MNVTFPINYCDVIVDHGSHNISFSRPVIKIFSKFSLNLLKLCLGIKHFVVITNLHAFAEGHDKLIHRSSLYGQFVFNQNCQNIMDVIK